MRNFLRFSFFSADMSEHKIKRSTIQHIFHKELEKIYRTGKGKKEY